MSWPSSWMAARPSASAFPNPATMRLARAMATSSGVKAALAPAIWSGWMHILPWKPSAAARLAEAAKPSLSRRLAPDPIHGQLQPAGAGCEHAGGATWQQLGFVARPHHAHVEREVAGAERQAPGAGGGRADAGEVANADRCFDDGEQLETA